ncbi:MAG: YiiX/YebB-like N1pC/P60 family cysteine hydrolase [Prevotella sp.]
MAGRWLWSWMMVLACLLSACSAPTATSVMPDGLVLRQGDVVLRRGLGMASRVVLAADGGGEYSHVGIVAQRGDTLYVVHAVPYEGGDDRVVMELPERFFSTSNAVTGMVLRSGCDSVAQAAASHALTICLRGTLFNHDYDDGDTTRMYCSQLVEHVYAHAGMSLIGDVRHDIGLPGFRLQHVILPSDFIRSPVLKAVSRF